ncbi:hypothetical protein BCD48_17540 [Pseudofrankia sp. BMG5.36]|nr:hypothetical protein BCD48_17540 [Pseudofrankia sp. BMG5.36]
MAPSDVTLAILADGPFRGGTFVVRSGQTLTFGTSWLNSRPVVYRPTGRVIETPEGEAVVLRCETAPRLSRTVIDESRTIGSSE